MPHERDDFEVPAEPESELDSSPNAPARPQPPRKQQGGWADPKELPLGPSGRPLCRK